MQNEPILRRLRAELDHIRTLVAGVDARLVKLEQPPITAEPEEPLPPASFFEAPREVALPAAEMPVSPRWEVAVAKEDDRQERWRGTEAAKRAETTERTERTERTDAAPRRPAPEAAVHGNEEPLEITFGRVWLVRIGIVVLLTGLVLLGNLAYQQIVPRLGPGLKLLMIYLSGGALAAVGVMLERKRESLRNYARVLLAGGCAAIYYATYAAHFVPALQVIGSPLIGGSLLLGLAVAIGWSADRRKSETLALIALLLSYYTSGLNPIGGFTLFSSALLTATAVFFLVRHRWVRLTAVSLAGAYLSYAWCRVSGGARSGPSVDVFMLVSFLAGYWALFASGPFLCAKEAITRGFRAAFTTANNAAFFGLCAIEFQGARAGDFWLFALGFGGVLLALSAVARWRHPEDRAFDGAYLVHGLTLTTLGLALKLSGYQFAIVLAVQSVLFLAGNWRHGALLRVVGYLCAGGAALLAADVLSRELPHSAFTAGCVSFALLVNAWLRKRRTSATQLVVDPVAAAFVAGALILATACAWKVVGWPEMIPWMAAAAVACALVPRRLRLPELTVIGQGLLPLATIPWAVAQYQGGLISNAAPASLVAAGVGLSWWWARGIGASWPGVFRDLMEGLAATAATLAAVVWMSSTLEGERLMITASVVGTAWIGGGVTLRARGLASTGLAFAAVSGLQFWQHQAVLPWAVALVPIVHVLAIAWMARFSARLGEAWVELGHGITGFAGVLAGAMGFAWIFCHIPDAWQALFFTVAGAAVAITGAFLKRRVLGLAGLALGAIGWAVAVLGYQIAPTWQHLAAVLVVPLASRVARRLSATDPTHDVTPHLAWATMLGVTLWTLRWSMEAQQGTSLTLWWTLLALAFSASGLVLRDRHYRLGGLTLLGAAVARVFFVDVWGFDPLYRILSFIVLGIALLLLGYVYNRFEEKLRQWL